MTYKERDLLLQTIDLLTRRVNATQYYEGEKCLTEREINILKATIKGMTETV